ncbi:hypothetical protein ACI797_04055 [Geodermatophilus sp. SYSU D00691]
MPSRSRSILLALGLVLALLTGCTGGADDERLPGDEITREEADVLAELLHQNFEHGGADFVETAPYGEGAVLTLTGEVDFTRSIGRAQAVTTYEDGRPEEMRTLFFTTEDIWFGDVPGLSEALAARGLPDAAYVRRPMSAAAGGSASLIDVLAQLVLNLSARAADDPGAFMTGDYTWQGQRSIDGQLVAEYGLSGGKTVAISHSDDLLVQYVTPLPDQDFDVTITLSDHGEREIALPAAEETLDAATQPELAAELGV